MMKFLYVDKVNSLNDVRIAERTIWAKEIPHMGHEVRFLLVGPNVVENNVYNHKVETVCTKSSTKALLIYIYKMFKILQMYKPDFVVLRNHSELGFLSFLITRLFKTKFVYIKAFPLLEFLIRKNKSVYKRYFQLLLKLEVLLLKYSEYLIIRTKQFSEMLRSKYKINREFCVVPMGIDLEFIKSIDSDEEDIGVFMNQHKTGIYFGTLHKNRDINFILNILECVNSEKRILNFIFVGGNLNEIEILKNQCKDRKINNVVFYPDMDRRKLFNIIKQCDFSISAIPPIQEYIISSPTKVVESLGLGCPVIVNKEIIDQYDLVKNSKGGIAVDYEVEKFSKAIIKIIDNQIDLSLMKTNGRDYIFKHRNYRKLALKILNDISK
jgi:glycosyltransferase involved in cell wall biosynthesis